MKKLFSLFVFLNTVFTGFAQHALNQPDFYFEHFTLPGSLYFNPINDITQDSLGLLWFASDNGIYRYDGYEMTNSYDEDNFQHLRKNPVHEILAGPNNYIYAILEEGGVIRFKNDFSELKTFNTTLTENDIHSLFYFDNKIGFISKNKGLILIDEQNDKLIPIKSQHPIFSLWQSGKSLTGGSHNKIIFYENLKNRNIIELPQINANIENIQVKGDDIYFNTKTDIYKFNIKSEHITHLFNRKDIDGSEIYKVYKADDGMLWILSEWDGIYIAEGNKIISHLQKNYYQKGSISNNHTLNIYESRNGVIWIGTGAGINKYDKNKRYFSHLNHDPSNINTLSGDFVRSVFESSDEQLFIGTDNGVINIIDFARKKIKRIAIPFMGENNKKVVPFSFVENTAGKDFYIGTSAGLFLFDLQKETFTPLFHPDNPLDKRVRQILPYGKNHILGLTRGLVWSMDRRTGKFKHFNNIPADKKGLLSNVARTLYINQDNSLLIGCMGELAYFNPKTGEFTSRTIASISSLGDTIKHMVLSISRYDDKLYIGTFQGGLFILDLTKEKLKGDLKLFNKEDGLPDNTIYAVIRDSKGYFWLSTNNGVSRFDPKTENFINYDRSNGLQGKEYNRLAFTKTKRGEIVFGGIEGLNIFFPEQVQEEVKSEANPILMGVDIINQFDGNNKRMHPHYKLINKKELALEYDENYLTFSFTANNFSQPEKNSFYYKLENYDKNWIYSDDHTATYTGLKPGNYTFKVKAISPEGGVSTHEASLDLVITTLWWRTWWAGLIMALMLLGIVIYSFRKNVNKNKAIKIFLEQEIERRTFELKESKEELAKLNSKKDFIFSILSHDLRSPLTTLKGFLGILIDHFNSFNEDEIKTHAVNIKNSVAKSLDLLDNTLYWSLSQMGEISYTPSRVNLNTLFEKMHGLYDLTATKKSINLEMILKDDIELYADENMTYITLRNLLSNALKFTPTGKSVYVIAKKQDDNAQIIIQDEGHGIKAEDLSKLFDQNQHYMQKGTSNEKGTGLGLILCKKFTDLNNGSIAVESKENKGSRFIVTLPLFKESKVAVNLS